MPTRVRCSECGNLTRFDVIATRRTREFHHFNFGGELSVDETELVSEEVESVTCRWCGATGPAIQPIEGQPVEEGDLRATSE